MTHYLQEDTMNQTVTEEDVFTFPASHAQRRLWLVDQLEPGNPAYNVPNLILLKGRLDIEALEASVEEIIWRHESLRTTFEVIDGELMQVIAADVRHSMPIIDLTGMPRHEREREAHRLATEEARGSFDLKRGPLITTTLYRLREEEHWLMLNLHHIITDGWSMGILFRELAELYHAFSSDKPSPLEELSLQYADYANWQSEWLQGEVMQEQMSYWKGQLGGRLPVLQLPSDRPRKAVQTFNGRTDVFTYSQELRQSLLEVSRAEGATLFMTLLAAFNTLLHRWTGQDDICVGSPIAGRTRTELKEIVGCFVNTLVMRTDLSGQPTFRDLLARTKQVALDAYANQDMPLEMLIEALQPERNLSHPPLFQVMFVLQNAPMELLELPQLTLSHKETDNAAAHFDLFFSVKETAQGLYIKVNYNTDLFDPSTIERLMGHYGNLLQAIVEDADLRISEMPLVGEGEQHLLAQWSQGGSLMNAGDQSDALIHELFEAQAVRTPEQIALTFDGQSLTYRELNHRANQLAHHLQKKGIGPESIVGLCLERSLEMVIALLGVLKSGGAYLPLDPKAPLDRQRFVLEETNSRILLTQARFESRLAVEGLEVILLDEADLSGESAENPVNNATADSLAYVIYTSGSTGKPKGVLVPHRGVTNRLLWGQEHDPLTGADSVLQKTPYTFDVSVWEFFWPLSAGARLVLAKPEGHQDPSYLVELITQEGITTAHFVPSMLALFLEEKGLERIQCLRRVICSGEALSYELQERFFSRIGASLHNFYGPTETSIEVTYWDCQPESARRTVPIGHPIAGVEAYVLDSHLRPVPIGVAGELYLGGVCVTRGYLKRPELTEAVFVPHPFRAGERVYKTGDLVRVLTDGAIEYLGRLDHQVKIRGFRIELGEIETALLADSAIREAVVLAREDVPGDKRLVAYLVAAGTEEVPNVTELRTRLKESLPEYMVPSVFFFLDEMPLTSSGKADRKALPVPDALRPELAAEYVEPRNELEAQVVDLWTELLDVERVGVFDNFFDLGGHSLKATQLTAAITDRFGVELPLIKLFEEPTVAGLCRMIEAVQNKSDRSLRTSAPEAGLELLKRDVFTFPASHAQRRLWLFDQLEPGSPAYNVPNLIRLQGRLNIPVLEASLQEIIWRHESLRTTFDVIDGELMQVIAADVRHTLPLIDLTELPRHEREREAHRLANEVAGSSFDLKHGPLITTTLYRLREEEHWLMLNLHHTITDGWSMGILFRELAELYQALSHDKPSPLSELSLQYADFANWQNEWLQGEVMSEQLAYWQDQLGGGLPVLQLPTDRPRQAVQTYNGRTDVFVYGQELRHSLLEVGRQEGATLFMTLLAAFNTLLYRWTGQEDICVGSPIAGRTRTEVKEIVGCFVNTLVMRTDLSGQPTFRELLTRTKKVALDAYAHQDVPLETLIETLQPERTLSHSPLFQVLFVLQNAPLDVLELPELTMSYKETDSAASHFDLSFSVKETPQGLYVSVNYNTDLFDPSTIARLMGQYGNLLEAVAENRERPVSLLPLLDDAEREQVLTTFNDTDHPHQADVRLHERFEAQVARTPERVAVEFEGDVLTYDELNKRANRLASRLVSLGVGRGSRVGLHLERSLDLVVALLAVLKTGGAYVPLDPTYPPERLAYMAEDAELTVLLSQSHLERAWETTAQTLYLDQASTDGSDENLLVEGTEEDPCYILYTSGSTGTPKGVVIPHRALCNHMFWMQERFPLHEEDAVLQKTSFSFDASVWEFYAPLLVGARLVLAHPQGHLDPEYLVRTIEDQQITILQVVPSVLHLVLDAVKTNGCRSLKRVFCGGEALTKELQDRFHAILPAELVNLYGPTEACIDATYHVCVRDDERNIIPIGRPIDNLQAYVLDADLQPVPLGVPGELFLGGRGVALGYWKRAELTAERFVANPFGEGTLYRTGDLARWLPAGELEYLGRLDHQVKLRGYRIELGEIEAALVELDEVREAAVLVRDSQLIAYIVLANENLGSADVCRANLSTRLPEYMVPARFVVLEQMPLTPNGKLNRQALPDPEPSASAEQSYTAPRNETEQRLVTIWSHLLGRESIGVYDSFFTLGGHSLLAMQLLMRVREAFGVEVPLRSVFANPTVAELAVLVGSASSVVDAADVIVPVPRTEEMPLSFAQQRLLFFDRFQPDSATYNIPYVVRVTGRVEGNLMERCLQEVVRRHEVLRTTFTFTENGPMQRVHESVEVPLQKVDLRTVALEEREAEAMRLAREEASQPFDLTHGPLLRAVWVQLEETDSFLFLTMHHIASDGWSLDVLLHELTTLYTAFSQGKPSPLADLRVQYADYASWQQQRLQGNVMTEQLAYWREQLGGTLPLLELPTDHPRPALPSYRGAVRSMVLPQELLHRLQQLGGGEQATLYMTLLTAYQVLLHRYTGQDDLLVGSPVAGRNRAEVEALIGFFVNTLVLRGDLSGNPTFREALRRVRETALGAFAHQDVPFERLVEELQPERHISRTPLIQTMFVLQNTPPIREGLNGLSLQLVSVDNGTAKFDLSLVMVEMEDGLLASVEYSTDLFDDITVERMLTNFGILLQAIVDDPDQSLSDLALLSAEERHLLLEEWKGTTTDYPRDLTLCELFEAQVGETPDAWAVCFDDGRLTYRELNERAERLAGVLRAHGVMAGSSVAVSSEPSTAMIVGLVAIIKAGGVYVPLDPAHPQERLAFMLEDSRAVLLLADGSTMGRFAGLSIPVIRLDEGTLLVEQDSCDRLLISQEPDNSVGEDTFAIEKVASGEQPSIAATTSSPATTATDAACIIYTSGSTGNPKGVLVPHRGIVRLVRNTNCFELEPHHRIAQACNTSFDPFALELWGALLNGAELVGIRRELLFAPKRLKQEIREQNISSLVLPTALFHQVAQEAPDAFATLRYLIVGGEAIDPRRVREVMASGAPEHLLNTYGPTENATSSTFYRVEGLPDGERPIPIGIPVSNSEVYVLDAHLQPVPIGVLGELYLGGDGLALGYLHREDLTAERFIPHPFQAGQRLYKTGDRVRYRADGLLEFHGRLDQQIKYRGYRIEPGEIETVITRHPAIVQAFVTVLEDESAGKRLVAYLVTTGEVPEAAELQRFLTPHLPDYMVPTVYLFLDALPLTANGKVDTRALPVPDTMQASTSREHLPARNETEQRLVTIWEELLGVAPIGVTDMFFKLGGHSLLAMQLLTRIQAEFGRELPVALFFQEATIAHLATLLREEDSPCAEHAKSADHKSVNPIPIQPKGSQTPLFLVHPVGGTVFCYSRLAHLLGQDQPLYGLQARGVEQGETPLSTLEEMAAEYIEAIRTVQPAGPYRLGGWSLGGVIANEIAAQLERAGEQVEHLFLIDSFVPFPEHVADDRDLTLMFAADLLGGLGQPVPDFDPQVLAGMTAEQMLTELLKGTQELGLLTNSGDGDNETIFHLYRVFHANTRAFLNHTPAPYSGKATLYRAADQPVLDSVQDGANGWKHLITQLNVHVLPGDHFALLTREVQALAAHMRKQLDTP